MLEKTNKRPKIGIVLGSGLGEFAENLENATCLSYESIPNFPISTVHGHKGNLYINNDVICMQGRFHFYEGYGMQDVTFPIRVMGQLGVEKLIVTNAAGGVNKNFNVGDLMIINDHLNFLSTNPLMGKNYSEFGERFPDMSNAYNSALIDIAKKAFNKLNLNFQEGVYAAMTGPCYETPAEVRMLRVLGADAVGMSTVPETIVANHMKMKVLGISLITNMACGVLDNKLSHAEVIEVSQKVKPQFLSVLNEIVSNM